MPGNIRKSPTTVMLYWVQHLTEEKNDLSQKPSVISNIVRNLPKQYANQEICLFETTTI